MKVSGLPIHRLQLEEYKWDNASEIFMPCIIPPITIPPAMVYYSDYNSSNSITTYKCYSPHPLNHKIQLHVLFQDVSPLPRLQLLHPSSNRASILICLPGMASKVNLAATSETLGSTLCNYYKLNDG